MHPDPQRAVGPAVPAARQVAGRQTDVLAVISVGGALGSGARYGTALLLPADPVTGLPWATLAVNGVGCLLIGVLMVLLTEVHRGHRLLRPFFGVGFLGGFTTFSTYTADALMLLARGAEGTALGYLVLTVVVALTAVTVGGCATRVASRSVARDRRTP